MIDTHCHLNLSQYAEDLEAVLERAHLAGVNKIIIPAIDLDTLTSALHLADQYPGIFVAAGIHPNATANFQATDIQQLVAYLTHPKIVAIGEIGLDYHWDDSPKHKQFEALEAQLQLATEHHLPVIIHNREASEDTIQILEAWAKDLDKSHPVGVMHSFSGDEAIAERALAAGFYLGFTGPITFKKKSELFQRIATTIPLERLLVETDGPYLTPHPHRGQRNEPAYIPLIIEKIAALRGVPMEVIAAASTANAHRLFGSMS